MIRVMAIAAALVALTPMMSAAKTLNLPPKGNPVVTITIPDNWSYKVEDNDYEAKSPDDAVTIAAGTDSKLLTEEEIVKQGTQGAGGGVEVVPGSLRSRNDMINGLKAVVTVFELRAKGGTDGRKLAITLTQVVMPKPDIVVHLTMMNPSQSKAHDAELDAIFKSLTMVGTGGASAAAAGTAQVPATGNPAVTFTIPAGWSHKTDKDGDVELTPRDGTVHASVSFEQKPKTQAQHLEDMQRGFAGKAELVGPVNSGKTNVKGRAATITQVQIKLKETGVLLVFTLTLIPTKTGGAVDVGILGKAENLKAHEAEVEALFESLKFTD